MEPKELLGKTCYDEKGLLRPKTECRALLINHFILEDGLGVDDAEDHSDKLLNTSGFWPIPEFDWDESSDAEKK